MTNLSRHSLCKEKSFRLETNGFAYIALLIFIAALGLVAATSIQLGGLLQRRAMEEQLLQIGSEFSRALSSYAASTPVNQNARPQSLEDLLRDPRYPNTQRHLRKIYTDPMTGHAEWNVIKDDRDSGIVAITSFSNMRPLKIANFDSNLLNFENAKSYKSWFFTGNLNDLNKVQLEKHILVNN